MPGQSEPAYHQTGQEDATDEERQLAAGGRELQVTTTWAAQRNPLLAAAALGALAACALVAAAANYAEPSAVGSRDGPAPDALHSGRPTIRDVLEGPELNAVMTDNLMRIGDISPTRRSEMQGHVAANVRRLSDNIREQSPHIDSKMDTLTLTQEMKESVMRVMRSLGDFRVESVARDMTAAVQEALDFSLDREGLRDLILQRLQPRLDELHQLRDEIFPHFRREGDAGKGYFDRLADGIERSRLMQEFDRWTSRTSTGPASAQMRHLQADSFGDPDELDGSVMDQLREFFTEIHDSFRFELQSMKDDLNEMFSIANVKETVKETFMDVKQGVRDQIDEIKQDFHDEVSGMRQQVRDTFSPKAVKQNLHDQIRTVKESLSPRNAKAAMKKRLSDMFSYGYGGADDESDGAVATAGGPGVMECMASAFALNPVSLLTCSMHAMSFCVDLVRSLFN
mmetsp:Transcript_101310/g.285684  ORF Transcript_101310/g.285684 Transcript_101310/m.285684 type:complete len:454 (+) Transcript_101310:110-1471(+)